MTAWVSAHRVVLAHLAGVVTATATKESPPDATVTMTNPAKRFRGVPSMFDSLGVKVP